MNSKGVETNYWFDAGLFFQTKYSPLIDSFSNLSITEIGKFIQTDAEKSFFMQWDILSSEYSFLFPATFRNIAKTQTGLCPEFTAYTMIPTFPFFLRIQGLLMANFMNYTIGIKNGSL